MLPTMAKHRPAKTNPSPPSPAPHGSGGAAAALRRRRDAKHPSLSRRLDLSLRAPVGARHVPFLRRFIRAAHAEMRTALCELSVALVGDSRMSELHQRFMNIPDPTDVLTFELERSGRDVISGEIVVCVPEARRRTVGTGTPVQNELLLYIVHGMLHLSGFDDRSEWGYRRMHREEDRILKDIGIGPVFTRPPRAGKLGKT